MHIIEHLARQMTSIHCPFLTSVRSSPFSRFLRFLLLLSTPATTTTMFVHYGWCNGWRLP